MRSEEALSVPTRCWNRVAHKPGSDQSRLPALRSRWMQTNAGDEMAKADLKNMDYWQRYGDYVLMAMPYADEVLVEGHGCTVRDANGKELLDLASGMFCCVLGHNHPKFIQRISQQAR